ncbi:MAG: 1-pyrroline-5-carboxylate dehydrogenase [Lysobacteraceae bacterium]|nr:MAG: 1-pyrroline-5-carboxylate dehydrogenase [Xanthomonadaceae bacterium]
MDRYIQTPPIANEHVNDYAPGDPKRESLQQALKSMAAEVIEIPCFINGKEVRTGNTVDVVMPHDHAHVLAKVHEGGQQELTAAADAAVAAQHDWQQMPWEARAAIFLKAAELIAGPWRDRLNASTMLGQSKNAYQAEIDAACEFIDFLRFNVEFYRGIVEQQPMSGGGVWNSTDWRPLEGFVLAITPFNFTAIAGNLPTAPALCGNTVVWKPSSTQMLSAWYTLQVLREAGLPDGVINMVPADGPVAGAALLPRPDLAGVHFTGSTATFHHIYAEIGQNIQRYQSYPRLVGETGGKDFIFADQTADADAVRTALVRGAFEYQGQKCSAASRAYIPHSLWAQIKSAMLDDIASIKVGDVRDFSNFVNAVIDQRSFDKINGFIAHAEKSSDAQVLCGGQGNGSEGYFIPPTVVETTDPGFRTMCEEIFGPVLTVYPYPDNAIDEALTQCDGGSAYGLTGAIFSQDRASINRMTQRLRHAAGNFYINDKPTGAVVGQQPFGGGRASGTNDKAGSALNLYRWMSPRTIKETMVPPTDYRYPFLG